MPRGRHLNKRKSRRSFLQARRRHALGVAPTQQPGALLSAGAGAQLLVKRFPEGQHRAHRASPRSGSRAWVIEEVADIACHRALTDARTTRHDPCYECNTRS